MCISFVPLRSFIDFQGVCSIGAEQNARCFNGPMANKCAAIITLRYNDKCKLGRSVFKQEKYGSLITNYLKLQLNTTLKSVFINLCDGNL